MAQISQERCLELIEAIATEIGSADQYRYQLTASTIGAEILELSLQEQATLVIVMLDWCEQPSNQQRWRPEWCPNGSPFGFFGVLIAAFQLMNRQLPFEAEQIMALLSHFLAMGETYWSSGIAPLTRIVELYLRHHPLTPGLRRYIQAAVDYLDYLQTFSSSYRKFGSRLRALIHPQAEIVAIVPGEAWADVAIHDINTLPTAIKSLWMQLIVHCSTAIGGKPSAKWLKSIQPLVGKIGWDNFVQALLHWFPLVDKPRTLPITALEEWEPDPNNLLNDTNADILKGLVWLCAEQEQADLVRALTKLAFSAYRKAPGVGPRCVRVGNACVWALGQMPGGVGIAQLALLKLKVKFGTAQKRIETALTTAAERIGLPRSEVEELSVPSYGMEAVGMCQDKLGDFTAELLVTGTSTTELRWLRADGKPQKSVPQSVKDNYAEELKELKQTAKDIQTMLPAQRDRIESCYLQQKTWGFATWQARYLNHPLVGTLARRLIWQFSQGDRIAEGIWLNGQLVNRDDQPLDGLTEFTQVQLWHPIATTPEIILAWRNWLVAHQVQQPFKQAHREIYLLTAAEERTQIYSNRFAAHVLKQHQFNALCGQRGWKNQLQLMVDDCYSPAMLLLPQWKLRAEFWIEGIGDNYGTDTTEAGTFLYLATDQVRFYATDAAENLAHAGGGGYASYNQQAPTPVPLEQIPALVFTEVMRDIDLFVGVASVGNDPNWADGGPEGRHYNYWQGYSFGDLSETAKTRRQVLETLIPRLQIRDRCHFQDKFLVVRGDLRPTKFIWVAAIF